MPLPTYGGEPASVGVQDDRQNYEMETAEEQQEVDIENLQKVPRIPKRGRPPRELPLPYTPEWTEGCPGCEGKTSQHTAACLRNKRFLRGDLPRRIRSSF
eukprot:4141348-Amphidinium_carterae.3